MKADDQTDVDPKATEHFLRCISVDDRGVDEIDRKLDALIVVDPYECHAPGRRSDKELAAVLAILDELNQEMEDAP
jgi:Holliday junction resolvasome RuvABC ATP-dependent DNA helicase subunit